MFVLRRRNVFKDSFINIFKEVKMVISKANIIVSILGLIGITYFLYNKQYLLALGILAIVLVIVASLSRRS